MMHKNKTCSEKLASRSARGALGTARRFFAIAAGNIVLLAAQGCGGNTPAPDKPTTVTLPNQPSDAKDTTASVPSSKPAFYCHAAKIADEKPAGCEPTLEQCEASLAASTRQGAEVVETCNGVAKAHCLQYKADLGSIVWRCLKTEAACADATAWVKGVFAQEPIHACAAYTAFPEALPAKH